MPIEIHLEAPDLDAELVAAAAAVSFPTLGHLLEQGFVDPAIRAMTTPVKLVGRAITVRTVVPDSALVHRATDLLGPGDVLVVDAGGAARHAPVGEMVALAAHARGAAGIVVDGMCTDLEEIRAMGIALFARGTSLLTTKLHGLADGGINVPVLCGGVRVDPGHVVLADDNGIAMLAPAVLEGVLDAVRASEAGELELRAHVQSGGSLAERSGARGLVDKAVGDRMSTRHESRIKHMSWTAFDRRRKETQLALVPSGAIEVYGPHLPLGSDIIVAERVAQLVAERVPSIIAPSVEVGDSTALSAFPGTLVTSAEHLKGVYGDICRSLAGWGFRRFLFLNTHLGNVAPLDQLAEELQSERADVRCAAIDWWRFVQHAATAGVVETSLADGHASETGTSVLLHLAPDDVTMADAPVSEPLREERFPDIITYPSFDELTATGTIGDATAGSARKGRQIVETAVDRIAVFLEDFVA